MRERRPGEVVVDGRRLVEDLVRWRVPLLELYLAAELADSGDLSELAAAAVECFSVDERVLAEVAPTRHPQGVLAIVAEPRPSPWSRQGGVGLLLDRVQDPGNVGAIARSAAALGASGLLLSPGCADPFHPAAVRASAGAVLRLPVEREVDTAAVAGQVRTCGGSIWAATSEGEPVDRWQPRRPLVILVGAEGQGLAAEVSDLADGRVAIPLERGIDSLNVGVAASILLWVALRSTR